MYNHPLITDNFNAEVEDHYFSVLDSLRRGEHALAQKSLETSLTLIRKRQKLIKLADGLLSKNMSKIISQTTRKMKNYQESAG